MNKMVMTYCAKYTKIILTVNSSFTCKFKHFNYYDPSSIIMYMYMHIKHFGRSDNNFTRLRTITIQKQHTCTSTVEEISHKEKAFGLIS